MRTLLLPILAFAACTGADEGPHYSEDDSDESTKDTAPEDDADDPEHAIALDWDTEISGSLDGDDSDWYRVAGMSAGQHFRVQVINDDENASELSLDTIVEVYSEALVRIAWEDDHPVGDVSTYDTVCFGFFPEAGSYYVRVLDKGNFEGSVRDVDETDYTVQLLAPSSPPEEPDSILRLGLDIAMDNDNSWYALPVRSDSAGDEDYVRFTLAHNDGAITFARAHHIESSAYAPALTLYDGEGTPVLHADTVLPSDFRQYISPPDTTYILGVSDTSGSEGASDGMWVFISNSEAGYGNTREREPNNDGDTAMALTLADQFPDAGSWVADFVEGRIDNTRDEDWYSFRLDEEAYVSVAFGALSYGSLLEATVALHGEGVEISDSADGGADPTTRSSAKLPVGAYTVSVSAADGVTGGEGSFYRLAVHVTSVPL
jgi:hypothetical protein